MKQKRKQSKQVQDKYFKKQYNSKIRQEYTDLDYIHKLDNTKKNCKLPDGTMVTEFEYMNIFMKEWNNADVGKQSEAKKNKFHRTAEEVKDCTDRNNSRNRDEYGIAKANNLVSKLEQTALGHVIDTTQAINPDKIENALIELLDQSKKLTKTSSNSNE